MKYDNPKSYNEISPCEILRQQHEAGKGCIDLPSYELLFKRFTSGDWGSDLTKRPKIPHKAVEHIVDFLSYTN